MRGREDVEPCRQRLTTEQSLRLDASRGLELAKHPACQFGASGPGAFLGLAMFEVSVYSTVAVDQLLADSPDLFHDHVVHVLLLRMTWPKRTCGIVSGETSSGARKSRL